MTSNGVFRPQHLKTDSKDLNTAATIRAQGARAGAIRMKPIVTT